MKNFGFAVAGMILFALPFLSMGVGRDHHDGAEPHMDHAPYHGGLLLMVGDHHLEIVESEGAIEVYVSDARRIPLRPVSGRIRPGEKRAVDLVWDRDRLIARDVPASQAADYEVTLDDATVLEIRVPRQPT